MKRQAILVLTLLLFRANLGSGDIVIDTGPQGVTNGGSAIYANHFLAANFTLDEPYLITDIGGHIKGSSNADRSIFAAVVPLLDETGLPSDNWQNEVAYISIVEAPFNDIGPYPYQVPDTVINTSFVLEPGSYALLFGSGLFGATGSGWMPVRGPMQDLPWLIQWRSDIGWRYLEREQQVRFFVHGEVVHVHGGVVPAPSAVLLSSIGMGFVSWLRRRRIL